MKQLQPHPLMAQLREAREDQEISQSQLATTLCISRTALSSRETGRHSHGIEVYDAHARALGYRLALIPLEGTQ